LVCSLGAEELRIRTIAGNGEAGGAVAGALAENTPAAPGFAVAVDGQDRVLMTTARGEIWRIGTDGRWELVWRPLETYVAGVDAGALSTDGAGYLYLADSVRGEVRKIAPDRNVAAAAPSACSRWSAGGRATHGLRLRWRWLAIAVGGWWCWTRRWAWRPRGCGGSKRRLSPRPRCDNLSR